MNPYQIQVENAIALLKTDLPTLFHQDISYDIYTQDIYFRDPVNTFKGKFNYRVIFWTLRFHAQLFFTKIYFDLHEVKQTESNIILATWTVRGDLRVPWKSQIFFNGYSTYKLNEEGLIYEHIDTWDRPPSTILKQFITPKVFGIKFCQGETRSRFLLMRCFLLMTRAAPESPYYPRRGQGGGFALIANPDILGNWFRRG